MKVENYSAFFKPLVFEYQLARAYTTDAGGRADRIAAQRAFFEADFRGNAWNVWGFFGGGGSEGRDAQPALVNGRHTI